MIKITPARRAARAPPFTLHRDCSHHQYNISAHARSSPRGIGILAPAPRCDQRAGGRRTRRTPPKLATHRARTRHGTLAGSFRSSSLRTTSQQPPPRLRAGHGLGHGAGGCGQPMGAGPPARRRLLCAPAFGTAGPRLPPGSLPRSVARHALRSDPDATAKAPERRNVSPHQKPRMRAGEFGSRIRPAPIPGPSRPRPRGRAGRHAPWVPRSCAETGATSGRATYSCTGTMLVRTDALLLVSTRAREGVVPTSVLQCRYKCDYCRAVH